MLNGELNCVAMRTRFSISTPSAANTLANARGNSSRTGSKYLPIRRAVYIRAIGSCPAARNCVSIGGNSCLNPHCAER